MSILAGLTRVSGSQLQKPAAQTNEWCSDWYDPAYYAVSPERDPQGPPRGATPAPHLPQRKASRGGRLAARGEGEPLRGAEQHPAGVPV